MYLSTRDLAEAIGSWYEKISSRRSLKAGHYMEID